jgi:hypothetical protein
MIIIPLSTSKVMGPLFFELYFMDRKGAFLNQIIKGGWGDGGWRAIRLFQQE